MVIITQQLIDDAASQATRAITASRPLIVASQQLVDVEIAKGADEGAWRDTTGIERAVGVFDDLVCDEDMGIDTGRQLW